MRDRLGLRDVRLVIPATEWAELEEARTEYDGLARKLRLAQCRIETLTTERAKAERADRLAHALALRAREAKPTTDQAAAVDELIAEATAEASALETAIAMAEDEIVALVEERHSAWSAALIAKREQARQNAREALSGIEGAWRAMQEVTAAENWLSRFPQVAVLKIGTGVVHGLKAPSGEAYGAEAVFAALRAETHDPEPEPRPPAQPLQPYPYAPHPVYLEN